MLYFITDETWLHLSWLSVHKTHWSEKNPHQLQEKSSLVLVFLVIVSWGQFFLAQLSIQKYTTTSTLNWLMASKVTVSIKMKWCVTCLALHRLIFIRLLQKTNSLVQIYFLDLSTCNLQDFLKEKFVYETNLHTLNEIKLNMQCVIKTIVLLSCFFLLCCSGLFLADPVLSCSPCIFPLTNYFYSCLLSLFHTIYNS